MTSQAQQKILVIKLSALGDFIQALGPMAAIRKHHPDAHITLLTTKPFASFGEKCGYFNDIWIDQKPKGFNFAGWLNLRRKLISGQFNRVYDLQNNDRTSFYFKLFPSKHTPEWVGAAKGASHENNAPSRTAGHAFDGHVETLGLAGIKNIEVDDLKWINEDIRIFNLKTPYVLLVTGCAPQHPYKRWPQENYAALAQDIFDRGFTPVLLGTGAERDINKTIMELCPHCIDLTGKTSLMHIASLAHHAHAAIGNDTGPMHMIGPTGIPCIVLFSKHSNPMRHAPKGHNVTVLQEDDLSLLLPEKVIERFLVVTSA